MGKALYKDMSRSELLAMREQGMSNQEIADALAVHYTTVLGLIGKQPRGLKKNPMSGRKNLPENPRGGGAGRGTARGLLDDKEARH